MMQLWEIFRHSEALTWQSNGRSELSRFVINDVPYVIQITRYSLQMPELQRKYTAEVAFFQHDDAQSSEAAFSTNNKHTTPPVKVYGAVTTGLAAKIADYDAFYFSAERRHTTSDDEYKTKLKIYEYAAHRVAKSTGHFYYERENHGSTEFLVSKIELSAESRHDFGFKNPLGEALLDCNIPVAWYK